MQHIGKSVNLAVKQRSLCNFNVTILFKFNVFKKKNYKKKDILMRSQVCLK
jgi:hypothetical protein